MRKRCSAPLRRPFLGLSLPLLLILSGCGGVGTAIGMIGSTVVKQSDEKQKQADLSSDFPTPQPEKIFESHKKLGVAYLRERDYEKALARLDKAKEQKADDPVLENLYALVYQETGEHEKAEEHYRHALRLQSDHPQVLNNYGQFLCMRKRYEEAEQMFYSVLESPVYENPEITYTNLGICAHEQGDSPRAAGYLQQALSLKPGIPQALLLLCRIEWEKHNLTKARKLLREYQRDHMHTAESAWLGIQIEQVLGDKDALASYSLLLEKKFGDSEYARMHRDALSGSDGGAPGSNTKKLLGIDDAPLADPETNR